MLKVVDGGKPEAQEQPPRPDPLADLALRARQGDEGAMRELLRAIANPLLAAVRAVAGRNAPDIEDIAQETMVAFVQALRRSAANAR